MEQIALVIHLLVALGIIGLIMLQQGKGADMGASFGAGASQTLLGSTGSGTVLSRATAWLVVLFFTTSFSLAWLASQRSASVDDIDLEIPSAAAQVVKKVEDIPVRDDDVPAVLDDVPAAEPLKEDIPNLD